MSGRELLHNMIHSFFVIVSGTFISMFVFCLLFNPDATFSLQDFGEAFIVATLCDMMYLVFYSKKVISKKQMMIRQSIHFVLVLATLVFCASWIGWVDFSRSTEASVFVGLVIGVYFIVIAIQSRQSQKLADQLNEKLKAKYKG